MSDPTTCTLCDAPLEAGVRPRLRHLRAAHPAAYRGLVLRLALPWVFLVVVLAFLAFSLPSWVPVLALIAALVASFALRRNAMIEAGGPSRPSLRQMLRAGGYGAIALFAVLLLMTALTRG
jgi:small-conductance mechanosensitive channel